MVITDALITGGAGFVGKAIMREIREQYPKCHITILDRLPHFDGEKQGPTKYYQADITSPSELEKVFQAVRPQVVIHTAGIVPPLSERFARRMDKIIKLINVDGTRNVLHAAIESGAKAFVYTGSASALIDNVAESYANVDERWPCPSSSYSYGESKALAEKMVIAANGERMSTCVLRPAPIFGEGDQQVIPTIHACISKRETPYKLGEATNLWDVVYIGNVAYAHVLAAKNLLTTNSAAGEVFFIQNNEPISFRDFSLAIWKEFGHYPPLQVKVPQKVAWFLGWLAEWYTLATGTPTTLSRGSVLDACAIRYASGEKAKRILGYEAKVGLEEGLKRSCREYANRIAANSDMQEPR